MHQHFTLTHARIENHDLQISSTGHHHPSQINHPRPLGHCIGDYIRSIIQFLNVERSKPLFQKSILVRSATFFPFTDYCHARSFPSWTELQNQFCWNEQSWQWRNICWCYENSNINSDKPSLHFYSTRQSTKKKFRRLFLFKLIESMILYWVRTTQQFHSCSISAHQSFSA